MNKYVVKVIICGGSEESMYVEAENEVGVRRIFAEGSMEMTKQDRAYIKNHAFDVREVTLAGPTESARESFVQSVDDLFKIKSGLKMSILQQKLLERIKRGEIKVGYDINSDTAVEIEPQKYEYAGSCDFKGLENRGFINLGTPNMSSWPIQQINI